MTKILIAMSFFLLILTIGALARAEEFTCPSGSILMSNVDTERTCKKQDENGNLIPHGKSAEYFTNGAIHKSGEYKNGRKFGQWTWWYPNGKKMQEGYFKNDSLVAGTLKQWDEHGNLVSSPNTGFDRFSKSVKKSLGK